MNDKDILEAIKIIIEYCDSRECENCKIENICDEIFPIVMPYYWDSRIKIIEERMANENICNS